MAIVTIASVAILILVLGSMFTSPSDRNSGTSRKMSDIFTIGAELLARVNPAKAISEGIVLVDRVIVSSNTQKGFVDQFQMTDSVSVRLRSDLVRQVMPKDYRLKDAELTVQGFFWRPENGSRVTSLLISQFESQEFLRDVFPKANASFWGWADNCRKRFPDWAPGNECTSAPAVVLHLDEEQTAILMYMTNHTLILIPQIRGEHRNAGCIDDGGGLRCGYIVDVWYGGQMFRVWLLTSWSKYTP